MLLAILAANVTAIARETTSGNSWALNNVTSFCAESRNRNFPLVFSPSFAIFRSVPSTGLNIESIGETVDDEIFESRLLRVRRLDNPEAFVRIEIGSAAKALHSGDFSTG
jgi:hypothetical protein